MSAITSRRIPNKRARVESLKTTTQRTELDSHADTCVISQHNALITYDYDTPVTVTGFTDKVGNMTCKTVTGVIAYDTHEGNTYYLHLHQALQIDDIQNNLLCPMQLRDRGLRVNDEPKHMVLNPTESHHAITIPAEEGRDELHIPLSLCGVTHYFPTRKPTREEYDKSERSMHIDLTSEEPEWNPQDDRFNKSEETMTDSQGKIREKITDERKANIIAATCREQKDATPDEDLAAALQRKCCIGARQTKKKLGSIDAATLA